MKLFAPFAGLSFLLLFVFVPSSGKRMIQSLTRRIDLLWGLELLSDKYSDRIKKGKIGIIVLAIVTIVFYAMYPPISAAFGICAADDMGALGCLYVYL